MHVEKYRGIETPLFKEEKERELLTQNLRLLGSHIELGGALDPSRFRIVHTPKGTQLKVNSFFMRLFYGGRKHHEQMGAFTKHLVRQIETIGRQAYVKNPELAIVTQRFQQSIASQERLLEKAERAALKEEKRLQKKVVTPADLKKLERAKKEVAQLRERVMKGKVKLAKADMREIPELEAAVSDKVKHLKVPVKLRHDKPVLVKESRLGRTELIRRYPTDLGIDHMEEAKHIFSSTQLERILNLVGRMLRAVGFRAKFFDQYRYSIGMEKGKIYASDKPLELTEKPQTVGKVMPPPSSYWLGHASNLFSIPLRSKNDPTQATTLRVITDPVETDLNKILYPRMTKFARPMDTIPAPQVYLLSHNHLDHYSAPTIQKLLAQQPVMVVPKGDGWRYWEMGFKNVHELDWWEGAELSFTQNEELYSLTIRAVPARHWAGQGPCGGHSSTFLGYLIEGHEDGPIYFAGDTAPLDFKKEAKAERWSHRDLRRSYNEMPLEMLKKEVARLQLFLAKPQEDKKQAQKEYEIALPTLELREHALKYTLKTEKAKLKAEEYRGVNRGRHNLMVERAEYYRNQAKIAQELAENGETEEYSHIKALRDFKPTYYFAPGGPDDVRSDMETTHQSSAYGLLGHVEILLEGLDYKRMSKKNFLEEAHQKKTVYMHTMAFKLGNLKLSDTPDSLERVLTALRTLDVKQVKANIDLELENQARAKYPKHPGKREKYKDSIRDNVTRAETAKIKPKEATQDQKWRLGVRSYEWEIVEKLHDRCRIFTFPDGSTLTPQDLSQLLQETVVVPKIGSNFDLRGPKSGQQVVF